LPHPLDDNTLTDLHPGRYKQLSQSASGGWFCGFNLIADPKCARTVKMRTAELEAVQKQVGDTMPVRK